MKKHIVFQILLFLYVLAYGQGNSPAKLPTIVSPSPDAYSLGKYGQIPIGLFTGTVQYNIPLYEIKVNGLTIPISLNYSSNGIRVDEMPSSVGLGWSLSAGGVVIRNLNGSADEVENNRIQLPNYSCGTDEMNQFLGNILANPEFDTQPDIFSFNFSGYVGKFYLDTNSLKPTLIEPAPLSISKLPHFGENGANGDDLKIIAPDGVSYWFGGTTATEITRTQSTGNVQGGGPHYTLPVETAWHLTKIDLLNKDAINFLYVPNILIYDAGISQKISALKYTNPHIMGEYSLQNYQYGTHDFPVVIKNRVESVLLTEINWPGGKVKFEYNSMFTIPDNAFKKLQQILIYDNKNNLVKKYCLDYKETSCDMSYMCPDPEGQGNTFTVNRNRIFLEKITECTSSQENPVHVFEYYDPDQLPPRLSYAQDYWGYFNGRQNPDLVPHDISSYNTTCYEDPLLNTEQLQALFHLVGGDRNADGTYGVKGLLKKITYPTKGSTQIQYEPHSYLKTEFEYPQSKTNIDLTVESGNVLGTKTETYTTGIIPFSQEHIPISFLSIVGKYDCTGPPPSDPPDTNRITMSVTITDIQTNLNVPLEQYVIPYGYIDVTYNQFALSDNATQYFVSFEPGKSYKIEISISWKCLLGRFAMSYYSENGQYVTLDKTIGGMRVSKIINITDGVENIKEFYYGNMNCSDCSSGIIEIPRPAISFHEYEHNWLQPRANTNLYDIWEETKCLVTLHSSSMSPLYNSQGYHISYNSVIEGIGNNMEDGVLVHTFETEHGQPPIVPCGDQVIGTAYSNVFGNGRELKTETYKNERGNLNKIETTYTS